MSIPLIINGVTYEYPQVDDSDWGIEATDWAAAVTVGMLQKAGGLFQLLAEVDFGTAYGIKSLYLKSRTANPADAGQIRFAKTDVLNWRDNANAGNLSLGISASDVLQFNGADIQAAITVSDTSTIDLTFVANALSAAIVALSIDNSLISNSAAIAYSKLALTDSIVNADINSAAAIAYSKLSLSNSIVNADINASAAIAYSKLALTGTIVDADISASAAIAFSKLATLSSANILVGSAGNVATAIAVTGDVTISNTGVTAIGVNKVVNSMLAQMAQSTFKGRAASSGTGDPVDLTATQATAILNNVVGDSGSGGTKGLVPAPAAGDAAASKFLKADGTWAAPAGAGDVVGPASSTDSGFAKFDGVTGKLLKNSAATLDATIIADGSVNNTEFQYINSLTSNAQTQIDAKAPSASPTFTGVVGIADGLVGTPGLAFSADLNTGLYRIGTDSMGLTAGGFLGLGVGKSTGSFANVGMGLAPSTSDQLVLGIERSNASAGTYIHVGNTSTSANAYGGLKVLSDNSAVFGNINVYTAASTVTAFISRLVLRADGNSTGISIMPLGSGGQDVRFYHNGGTSADESIRINVDKSMQFMQQISTPATPASNTMKMYQKAGDQLYLMNDAGTEFSLNPMTAGGDIIYGGTNGAPAVLANGSSGQLLTSAGGTAAPTWTVPTPSFSYVSKTSTYNPAVINDYINCSSTSFTITLPTAVGVGGKRIAVQHSGTSSTQVYTLATTSSQTIGGVAGGSYALYTNGEFLVLISDGANWQIESHRTNSAPVSYTPAFTNLGTVTAISFFSWREGKFLCFSGQWTDGTVVGSTASFSIGYDGAATPSGLAIDTTVVPTTAGSLRGTGAHYASSNTGPACGDVVMQTTTSTTLLYFNLNAGTGLATGSSLGTNSVIFMGMGKIPISGWQP